MAVLVLGLLVCTDGAFAKGSKGGKKDKHASKPAPIQPEETIKGTIKVDGEKVLLVAEDKTEYLLSASAAEANKKKNGEAVSLTGTVTTIEGKKWLTVPVVLPPPAPAGGGVIKPDAAK